MLNKAIQELQLENIEGAKVHINFTIRLNPKNSEALRLLSVADAMQGDYLNALASIRKVIKLDPKNGLAHSNHGNILRGLGRFEEAITSYKLAISYIPEYAEAHNNLGNLYQELRLYAESLPHYYRAVEFEPKYAQAYTNLGNAFSKLKRYDEALTAYIRAYELNPNEKFLLGNILHHKMLICDWKNLDPLVSKIRKDLKNELKVIEPFSFQGISNSEDDLKLAAEIFSKDHFPSSHCSISLVAHQDAKQIKVGYVCGEFRDHATSRLMVGVYEEHDKNKFEIFAFDNGCSDGSEIRKRIENSGMNLICIKNKPTNEVVNLVRELGVDILVNLNGFYGDGRQDVFAKRAAPIQVNYLGFPGTAGASYFDYLVADEVVIPNSSKQFYTEEIIYLPHSYQANDSKRAISPNEFSREELGLPNEAFVFCCFNNNYKITPEIFDSWMRILSAVPQGVLWLIEDNLMAASNLKIEASKRGISAERIIFAARFDLPQHLARHRQADLFLDTLPYNAHTTASDALWSGLPVLTCTGQTFPGRVATSLLSSLDLMELVVQNLGEYEEKAIDLARNPLKLQEIRGKLLCNRASSPLFGTVEFTRGLENLYIDMMRNYLMSGTSNIV